MHITDIYNQAAAEGRARFSVELLPPLKGDGPGRVFEALDPLREFAPVSVNVTSHREDVKYVERENGLLERHTVRRRPGTVGISAAIMRRYGVEAIPHLICGGQSRYDLEDALIDLDFLGIDNVLALRGDNLRGEHSFRVHPDGHGHACELVRQIARMNEGVFIDGEVEDCHRTNFCIGVAGYPEKHCEAPNPAEDMRRLKEKVDAGADYIITQMSFDNASILAFIENCRAGGYRRADHSGHQAFFDEGAAHDAAADIPRRSARGAGPRGREVPDESRGARGGRRMGRSAGARADRRRRADPPLLYDGQDRQYGQDRAGAVLDAAFAKFSSAAGSGFPGSRGTCGAPRLFGMEGAFGMSTRPYMRAETVRSAAGSVSGALRGRSPERERPEKGVFIRSVRFPLGTFRMFAGACRS